MRSNPGANAEIDVFIYTYDQKNLDEDCKYCGELVNQISGDEGNGTFYINHNSDDSCKYSTYGIGTVDYDLYNSYLERVALEGIENKTGTFAFSISVPDQAGSPGTIPVSVSAQVELGSGPVEGHFICYVDGYQDTGIQWTHAVGTGSAYTTTVSVPVPAGLTGSQSVVCKVGEASFTNLIHTSTDVFTAITAPGVGAGAGDSGASIGGGQVGESRKLFDFTRPTFENLIMLGVGICFLLVMTSKGQDDETKDQ